MSLSSVLQDWCSVSRYTRKPTVYLGESTLDLKDGEARLVRFVDRSARGMTSREAQRYVVEAREGDTLWFPFGAKPMSKQLLMLAMFAAQMKGKDND